jgi:uncharacterized protein
MPVPQHSQPAQAARDFKRIHVIDALRGCALAGVALVHMIEQYMGAPMPEAQQQTLMAATVDKVVMGLDVTFLVGKLYVLSPCSSA